MMGSELRASLASDWGDIGWRLSSSAAMLTKMRRPAMGWEGRGVKNLPNLLGVTEGSRLSFRRVVLVGERRPLAGDEEGG